MEKVIKESNDCRKAMKKLFGDMYPDLVGTFKACLVMEMRRSIQKDSPHQAAVNICDRYKPKRETVALLFAAAAELSEL